MIRGRRFQVDYCNVEEVLKYLDPLSPTIFNVAVGVLACHLLTWVCERKISRGPGHEDWIKGWNIICIKLMVVRNIWVVAPGYI